MSTLPHQVHAHSPSSTHSRRKRAVDPFTSKGELTTHTNTSWTQETDITTQVSSSWHTFLNRFHQKSWSIHERCMPLGSSKQMPNIACHNQVKPRSHAAIFTFVPCC